MLHSLLLLLLGISLVLNMLLLLKLQRLNKVIQLLLSNRNQSPWHLQSLAKAMMSHLPNQ